MNEDFCVYLLGAFRLYRNGSPISEWHTRQARQLFKLLLAERGHSVPARRLIDLLWPEYIENADKTLRSAISTLRNVLEPDRHPHVPSRFVPRGRGGYALTFPSDCTLWIDAQEFEYLLQATLRGHNTPEGRERLQTALKLYSGDYLAEDEEASWTQSERLRLRDCYFSGVSTLMEWQNEVRLYSEAVALGRKALVFDACYEPLYRAIMQAQMLLGDNAGALHTFEQCRQALDHHLGADPSPQTLALHTAILQGEASSVPASGVPARGTYIYTTTEPDQQMTGSAAWGAYPENIYEAHDQRGVHFIGRKAELNWLIHQMHEMKGVRQARLTRMVALVGEAGVGKSSLIDLALDHARAEGIITLAATCQALEQGLSFAPLISMLGGWLREASEHTLQALPRVILAQVATLFPILTTALPDLSVPATISPEQSYSMLITGLVDLCIALCQIGPLILVFDDLQWADESTLLVINRLVCKKPERGQAFPLLLLVSYRPEDINENPTLDAMLRYLGRERRSHIMPVERFNLEEVDEYLRWHNAAPPLSSESLYQVTRGNALFLVEAVRTLLEQEEQPPSTSDETVINSLLRSQQVRDVILARMARLPQPSIELLEIASVIGHAFPPDLLKVELAADDYQALDTLVARRFLLEVESGKDQEMRLAFSHEMVGQIIYAACSAPKLLWLHRCVADNMAKRYTANSEPHAGEIALHYRQAGPQHTFQALRYSVAAGDYARRTFSYRHALAQYDAALQLVHQLAEHPPASVYPQGAPLDIQEFRLEEWRRKIHYGRGLAYEALLDWEGIQESHLQFSAAANQDMALVHSSTHRVAITRSLMGQMVEAADIGRAFMQKLRQETDRLQQIPADAHRTRLIASLRDMTQRWTHLLTVTVDSAGSETLGESQDTGAEATARFPAFHPAPSPGVQDWEEMITELGAEQAAFLLAIYGWALLLQGLNAEAEQCLKVALKVAEETGQVTSWILASLLLSRVYELYGMHEASKAWMEQCLARCQQVEEAAWTTIWPLLNHAYSLIVRDQLNEAEQILHTLHTQLAQQRDFTAHRYSAQISLGLIALERHELERAETLLRDALAHQPHLYIEAYVVAEIGLATIATQRGQEQTAYAQLRKMLAFCGQHSLLTLYGMVALNMARLLLATGQEQGLAPFLEHVCTLLQAAGYTDMYKVCYALLQRIRKDAIEQE
ncbi:MAG: AAA family ATPase [Ktedonobacteraceae bacterium]